MTYIIIISFFILITIVLLAILITFKKNNPPLSTKEMAELEKIVNKIYRPNCNQDIRQEIIKRNLIQTGYHEFSDCELNYIEFATKLPYEEINKRLEKYDNSKPKEDELKMISELAELYGYSKKNIITRIQQIRRINTYKKLEEKKNEMMNIPETSDSENDVQSRYNVFVDGKKIGYNLGKDDLLVILNSLVNDQEYDCFDEIIFKKHK